MRYHKDFIGKQFGKLTVLVDTGRRNNARLAEYLCLCACGKSVTATRGELQRGHITSCGCVANMRSKQSSQSALAMIGVRFGKLVVVAATELRSSSHIKYQCQCDCGNVCVVYGNNLRSGTTTSCGCKMRRDYGNGYQFSNSTSPEMCWCFACNGLVPRILFGKQSNRLCHLHWLEYNRIKSRARFRANPGYDAARARLFRANNPDKVRARSKRSSARQKALGYPAVKKWQANHRDQQRAIWRYTGKRRYLLHPECAAVRRHRRRAAMQKAPGYHTSAELLAIGARFNHLCAYCGRYGDTWDHIVPICYGGSNFAVNMIPACKACNSAKQSTRPELFIKSCSNMTVDARNYILYAIEWHCNAGLSDYTREAYVKVPRQALLDELVRLVMVDGVVTERGLQHSKFSACTYRRRFKSASAQLTEIAKRELARRSRINDC